MHIAGMSVPPVLAAPGDRVMTRLRTIGSRGLLALLSVTVMLLVSVLGTLLPDRTLPLTWYVPALDMTVVVTLAVVFLLASTDAMIRRHGRLLPVAFGSVALGLVWLAHMLFCPAITRWYRAGRHRICFSWAISACRAY